MKTIRSLFNREDTAGIMFTLPFTLGFLFFMIVPMGISLYYSFCKYNILSPPVFTGLDNFKNLLKPSIANSFPLTVMRFIRL